MKIPVAAGLGGWIHKNMNSCEIYCKITVCLFLISDKNKATRNR